jgi:hypothetical protein
MSESVALQAVSGVRCSDADREWISDRLRDAAADGRLTMDELEDRLGGVYAARYHHELDPLVADLPRGAQPRVTARWLAVLAAAWAQLRVDLALLLGRGGSGWTRRRVVVAGIVALLLIATIVVAVAGFAFEGGGHHGFGGHGFDGPGGGF